MAKLNPKDPQFGIPIATRIREELAFRLNDEAIQENKTLSRYVAELIETAEANKIRLKELDKQFIQEKAIAKKTAGRFIMEISKGNQKHTTQLIQTYNNILNDERRNNV